MLQTHRLGVITAGPVLGMRRWRASAARRLDIVTKSCGLFKYVIYNNVICIYLYISAPRLRLGRPPGSAAAPARAPRLKGSDDNSI